MRKPVTDRNLERIARLGGGIAVQHRMMYQGEYFVARYGAASGRAHAAHRAHAARWACRSAPAPMRRALRPTIPG